MPDLDDNQISTREFDARIEEVRRASGRVGEWRLPDAYTPSVYD